MSKGEEIIATIKARAEIQEENKTAIDEIVAPENVNLTNINEKNNETLDKINQMSR